ncbi:MAG TPA: GntR family transcriptional regulator [Anaerolineae bacterium]|nr:GntR family transcriptional regulator [Anaerolineae bacterium]HIP97190.1 GntR family transcriptional regulator [Anaerolineae bacterium]
MEEIRPVVRSTLVRSVAARLVSLIVKGTFKPGDRLPSERQLARKLQVGRSTIREALQSLALMNLVDIQPGRGTFVKEIDVDSVAYIEEMVGLEEKDSTTPSTKPLIGLTRVTTPGPTPLPPSPEKPVLRVPDLRKDRLGTFEFISWWEREKVQAAKMMVVGAGALGNEVLKNLALMGVGHLFIVDFDTIEAANLSRSVLFRPEDNGKKKAEVAARRIKELNPDVQVQFFHGDINTDLGLGVFRRMDVVIGCLDNREARLSVNRFCYWLNKPWVDGAIQELFGLARVFVPGQGACFECTLTEQARREMSLRYSCPLLARQNILLGKVPTTPTISAIIGGIQSQEALKLLHDLPVEAGKVMHFNGLTNEVHTTAYVEKEDCESHWIYGDITELPDRRARDTTLAQMLEIARAELGEEAVLELDQEIVLALECHTCHTVTEVLKPVSRVSLEEGRCPGCGDLREVHMSHVITGDEPFLERTLLSIGVPPLHILRARNSVEYRFFELTGDLEETLHFAHFIAPSVEGRLRVRARPRPRIKLGPYVPAKPLKVRPKPRLKVKIKKPESAPLKVGSDHD